MVSALEAVFDIPQPESLNTDLVRAVVRILFRSSEHAVPSDFLDVRCTDSGFVESNPHLADSADDGDFELQVERWRQSESRAQSLCRAASHVQMTADMLIQVIDTMQQLLTHVEYRTALQAVHKHTLRLYPDDSAFLNLMTNKMSHEDELIGNAKPAKQGRYEVTTDSLDRTLTFLMARRDAAVETGKVSRDMGEHVKACRAQEMERAKADMEASLEAMRKSRERLEMLKN